jgi:tRNA nucleotidyltransferase (CCA-adding enzyme)
MVREGEAAHLVAERVWAELSSALMEDTPSRCFALLRETGALAVVLPELDRLFGVPQVAEHHPEIDAGIHTLMVVDQAARLGGGLAARFAALVHDLGKGLTPRADWPRHVGHEKTGLEPIAEVCERLRVPTDCRDLARLVGAHHLTVHRALELRPGTVIGLFERIDAFRRPQRLEPFLLACEADRRGRKGREDEAYPQADFLRRAHASAAGVAARPFVEAGLKGAAIAEAVHAERVKRVTALEKNPS